MSDSYEMLNTLWNERLITRVICRFGRALDTGDWCAYESCFTESVIIDFKRLTGFEEVYVSAKVWTEFAKAFQTPLRRHHAYSNFEIEIDDGTAHAIVYFAARTWRATDIGQPNYAQYGWYNLWLLKEGPEWRINRLRHDFQWIEGNAAVIDTQDPELVSAMRNVFSAENIAEAKRRFGS